MSFTVSSSKRFRLMSCRGYDFYLDPMSEEELELNTSPESSDSEETPSTPEKVTRKSG